MPTRFGWRLLIRVLALMVLCLGGCAPPAPVSAPSTPALDETPRLLILSAFDAELEQLLGDTQVERRYTVNGRDITTGTLYGNAVVVAESGVSMVNAAITTQSLLDRFTITAILFSGIAGGVNPGLHVGDVVIPAEWAEYQESYFARQKGDGWDTGFASRSYPNYGMIFPQPLEVASTAHPAGEETTIFWFPVDADMLALARQAATQTELDRCRVGKIGCLSQAPRIISGGRGVSGQAFVDNAEYREWIWTTFQADAVDMETAAVAHVAYANDVPFLAFRSLSDLAGGGPGENELPYFYLIAARNAARVMQSFLTLYASQKP
jgi:adenosylhomocysteine nucleosidase